MAIKMNDLYVKTVSQGLMEPGETLVAYSEGTRQSFWTFNIAFFKHYYLLLATSERLIVVDHRKGLFDFRLDSVDSYPLRDVSTLKLSGWGAMKKLTIESPRQAKKLKISLMGGLFSNRVVPRTKALIEHWSQHKALPARNERAALPASSAA
jgi:hypothetical protein